MRFIVSTINQVQPHSGMVYLPTDPIQTVFLVCLPRPVPVFTAIFGSLTWLPNHLYYKSQEPITVADVCTLFIFIHRPDHDTPLLLVPSLILSSAPSLDGLTLTSATPLSSCGLGQRFSGYRMVANLLLFQEVSPLSCFMLILGMVSGLHWGSNQQLNKLFI